MIVALLSFALNLIISIQKTNGSFTDYVQQSRRADVTTAHVAENEPCIGKVSELAQSLSLRPENDRQKKRCNPYIIGNNRRDGLAMADLHGAEICQR